ncbi:hypothetical protein V2G26_008618 [Clonostachys chloroleuca]|uniref:Uncharacterized protein n=1 Tax=Clonostachys chloroleuca TaxID=1926264 RepID=A0AA35QDP4_9HYPO|nr:unnamed protein product [Clonostachys chloroleuca]
MDTRPLQSKQELDPDAAIKRNVPGGEAEEDARSAAAHLQPAPYDPDISKEINLQVGRYCNMECSSACTPTLFLALHMSCYPLWTSQTPLPTTQSSHAGA